MADTPAPTPNPPQDMAARLTQVWPQVRPLGPQPATSDDAAAPGPASVQQAAPAPVPAVPATRGAALLDELHAALCRYVILPTAEAADAVVLWIAATHAQPAWEIATRLVISAPEKRCGKSRLLDVIEATCHAPLITVNISPAALVRSITANPPTLLLDEADTVFGPKAVDKHEDLRGILNAGHQRNRPYIRWDAAARANELCLTFAMAALAGIGAMPDTIADRAVIIAMRRRAPGERVEPFRTRRDAPPLTKLRQRLAKWTTGEIEALAGARPEMPVEDRAADNWEPLIAIADAAGGTWPARARTACLALTSSATADNSAGVRLLADLRAVFADAGDPDAMRGATLLERLAAIEEAPWADWYGKPFTARDLAKLLKPYGVASVDVKVDGRAVKGYRREHLTDAWRRYLPAVQPAVHPESQGLSATSATSATLQVSGLDQVAGRGQLPRPATGDPHLTSTVAQVAEVANTPHANTSDACAEPSPAAGLNATLNAVNAAVNAVNDPAQAVNATVHAVNTPADDASDGAACAACGQPMRAIEPGQTTHPMCSPEDTP
ncbi:DUF3631 domain-containing protein [Spirillospora sp. CA-253888]